jgi:hypothetical protein
MKISKNPDQLGALHRHAARGHDDRGGDDRLPQPGQFVAR